MDSLVQRVLVWLAFLVAVAAAPLARAQIPHWERGPQFAYPAIASRGTNGGIHAMTTWDPDGSGYQHEKLVVGGAFSVAGGGSVNNVAMWDGVLWRTLGSGFNSTVTALAVLNGELYAGGSFTASGANSCLRVARYNAAAGVWVGVGSGFNGLVASLAVHSNELFAGGVFTTSGATTVNHVARLSGGSWVALSGGGTNGNVNALKSVGLKLYVGGQFTTAGAVTGVNNLASWSSTTIWEECNGGTNGTVIALGESGGRLVVGGNFSTVKNNTIASPRVGLFVTGTPGLWISAIGFPNAGAVNSVLGEVLGSTEIFAGTSGGSGNTVYRYSGGVWTVSATSGGSFDSVLALTRYEGEVVAAGGFAFFNGGLTQNNIARLFDGNWEPLTPRLNGAVTSFTNFGSLVVGGSFESYLTNGDAMSGLFSWTGTSFGGYGHARGNVNALSVSSNGLTLARLNVGGVFPSAGNATNVNNVAQWNGPIGPGGPQDSFAALGTGFTSPNAAVYGFGSFGSTGGPFGTPILYAGGKFTFAGGNACRNVARYVGGVWTPLTTGVASANEFEWVNCFSNYGGQLIVGGIFDLAGGLSVNSIATWNGTAWGPLGAGLRSGATKGTVNGMAVLGTDLFVGGVFDIAGTAATTNFASWNGTTWTNRSAGLTNADETCTKLAIYGAELFASTSRTVAGGNIEGRVYRWTGSAWSQVGSTTDGAINALFPYRNRLHVGGAFKHAAGLNSRYWAVVNKYCPADLDNGTGFGTADGGVDINDLLYFLTKFEAGDVAADLDNGGGLGTPDGGVDINDLLYFLSHFEQGC